MFTLSWHWIKLFRFAHTCATHTHTNMVFHGSISILFHSYIYLREHKERSKIGHKKILNTNARAVNRCIYVLRDWYVVRAPHIAVCVYRSVHVLCLWHVGSVLYEMKSNHGKQQQKENEWRQRRRLQEEKKINYPKACSIINWIDKISIEFRCVTRMDWEWDECGATRRWFWTKTKQITKAFVVVVVVVPVVWLLALG